jgi:hypothetical protein
MSDTFKPFVADLPSPDIVDRLRAACVGATEARLALSAAADEIEALRDEGERLRITIDNLRTRLAQAWAKATGATE